MNEKEPLKVRLPYIYHSIIWTPILAFFAILTMGGGHGTYFFIKLLYPYTMLTTFLFDEINLAIFFIGLLQYLMYGIFFTIADKKGFIRIIIYGVTIIHFVAFLLCLLIPQFISKPYNF